MLVFKPALWWGEPGQGLKSRVQGEQMAISRLLADIPEYGQRGNQLEPDLNSQGLHWWEASRWLQWARKLTAKLKIWSKVQHIDNCKNTFIYFFRFFSQVLKGIKNIWEIRWLLWALQMVSRNLDVKSLGFPGVHQKEFLGTLLQ